MMEMVGMMSIKVNPPCRFMYADYLAAREGGKRLFAVALC